MKLRMKNLVNVILSALAILSIVSCSNDEEPAGNGSANMYVTDAPVDNAEISGVFVTVTDIMVDGHSVEGFNEQTINLMAYQNGKTKLLGTSDLDVGTYSNVELVLNYAMDADGNAPGCYAMTDNGKMNLASTTESTQSINASGTFDIVSNTTSDIIIDLNLRKAIKQNDAGSNQKYTFVTNGGLEAATRIVAKENAGSIEGTFDGTMESGEKVIVYAYQKGEFNQDTETQANSHGVMFANAKNSGQVESSGTGSGNYTISFLEEGDYELHFARYKENTEGEATFEAMLDVEGSGNVTVEDISVSAGADVTLNIILKGILG